MRSQSRSFVWWLLLAWTLLVCVFGGIVLARMLKGATPGWRDGLGFLSVVLWLLGAYALVAVVCHAATWLFPSWHWLDKYAWMFRTSLPGSGRAHGLTEVVLALFWTSALLVVLGGTRRPVAATLLYLAFGSLWMATGNYLGNATPKDQLTTQTKSTLADPEVWRRTHRFAGRIMFFWGFVTCILALTSIPQYVVFPLTMGVALLIARILPRLYSHRVYQQLHPGRKVRNPS